MIFNLVVVVRDPNSKDSRELVRSFDPAMSPATLQTKWNALGPAVLAMINELNAVVIADPNAPPLL